MTTQKDFIENNRRFGNKLTIISFAIDTRERVNTHSGLNLVKATEELVKRSTYQRTINIVYYDIPQSRPLDNPATLDEANETIEQFELNRYL